MGRRHGLAVSQSDRLGDTAANQHNHTRRHNNGNRACRDAIAAKATTEVILGDKGDHSPRAVAAAAARYKSFNDGHIPDIIHKHAAPSGNHVLYEFKCASGLCTSKTNLGTGTRKHGGSPGTTAGDRVAFGDVEDDLCAGGPTGGVGIFGRAAHGSEGQGPFVHEGPGANTGWVKAQLGYYHDAIFKKKNLVFALIANPFGGVSRGVDRLFIQADKLKAHDNTRYGVYSTHGFYNHHSTQLSLALVKGDNESILSQISFDQTRFTRTGVARRL